jgi:peroxiredoxin
VTRDERPRSIAGWSLGLFVLLGGTALLLFASVAPDPVVRGEAAPDFSALRLDGRESVSLSDFEGEVVLINFWATWCKPCEDEMPAMQKLYEALRPLGFELLAVSVDKEPTEVAAFRDRMGLSFPILLDSDEEVSRSYQTMGYPESILVDRRGRVVERYVGPRDWDDPAYVARIRGLLEMDRS